MSQPDNTLTNLDVIYKLTFLSPAHFGEDSSGLDRSIEFVHSDTLFSAVCYSWAFLFGSAALEQELIKPGLNENTPTLLLSSAFIFTKATYYLPSPMLELTEQDKARLKDIPELAKAFKESRFLPDYLWRRLASGKELFDNPPQALEELKAYKKSYKMHEQPRNYIPRYSGETTPYYCSSVTYPKGHGLYFLARFQSEAIKKKFETCLAYLQDSGLGGERSSGYGRFKWEIDEKKNLLNLLNNAQSEVTAGYILLSLASPASLPTQNEGKFLKDWRYELIWRRGFALPLDRVGQGETRKKNLLMLTEGSTLANLTQPKGKLHNVTNDDRKNGHSIYRSGLAYTWPYIASKVED